MPDINYNLLPREDILRLIPNKVKNILDVGCANGVLGKKLKEKGLYVEGIEINKKLAQEASKYIDKVHVCDLDKTNIKFKNEFDLVICADIIEHLKNPEEFLINYSKILSDEGYFIISVPNVRYYYVLWSLLKGEWKYADRGIFDKTHLRFFTLKSIKQLLKNCGLETVKINRNYRSIEKYCAYQTLAKYLSLYFLKDFLTFQYVILAKKIIKNNKL